MRTLQEAGAESPEAARRAAGRIVCVDTLERAVAAADLVVEAVVEKPEVTRVPSLGSTPTPAGAIPAPNTSPRRLSADPAGPAGVAAIAHWYTPPYIIDLSIWQARPGTDPGVIAELRALYEALRQGAGGVRAAAPGYVANRLQAALNLECLRMIDQGWATAETIDLSIRHGLASPGGCWDANAQDDNASGRDGAQRHRRTQLYQSPGKHRRGRRFLDRLIDAGRSGCGPGRGSSTMAMPPPRRCFTTAT
ncbi:MAG: 3-hydroxyacyl-CoA dehydrogenase NAD-binding domain-containing protein [Paracoccaceae bacterium]